MVAAVPGSKIVEVMLTQDFITRGTRAYSPAKHGNSPGLPLVSRKTLLSEKELALLMVLAR